jgi:large subunit ribosomal protein L25
MEYKVRAYYRQDERPKALRRQGKLPAVVYNRDMNEKIYVDYIEFDKVFRKASIHHVITLEFEDGKTVDTLVRQVNLDKRRHAPEHVDFYALAEEPIEMYVSLKFTGTPKGEKMGGVLEQLMTDILVKTLPKNIPESIEVDVSGMEIGDVLHVADLPFPEGVEPLVPGEEAVATLVPPEDVEKLEAEAEVPAEGEPEVIGKGKAEEEEEG